MSPAPGSGDYLRKVRSGEALRIPAKAYNAFVDAAQAHRRTRTGMVPRTLATPLRDPAVVLVKNTTGAARVAGEPMAISGPIILPSVNLLEFRFNAALVGALPAATDVGSGGIAIVAEPIGDDKIGRAVVDGVVLVKVKMLDEAHRLADLEAGTSARLISGQTGSVALLWVQAPGDRADADIAWCVGRLGVPVGVACWRAKITGATSLGGNRWRYDHAEVGPSQTTPGTWAVLTGGRTHTTSGYAYNLAEAANSGSGVQGNSVDVANLSGTFALKAAATNRLVWMTQGALGTNKWCEFDVQTMVDGACE